MYIYSRLIHLYVAYHPSPVADADGLYCRYEYVDGDPLRRSYCPSLFIPFSTHPLRAPLPLVWFGLVWSVGMKF